MHHLPVTLTRFTMLYVLLAVVAIIGAAAYLYTNRSAPQGRAPSSPGSGAKTAPPTLAAWNPQTFYKEEDQVSYNGTGWVSTGDANQGNPPDVSPTWWQPAS